MLTQAGFGAEFGAEDEDASFGIKTETMGTTSGFDCDLDVTEED